MRFATMGIGLLLAGCGAGANNSATPANAGVSDSAPDSAAPASPATNLAAPAASADGNPVAEAAPGSADGLVGRWGRQGNCAQTMEFFADGRVTIPDGRTGVVRWRVTGPGRLELSENGRGQTGGFEVREGGQQLRLTNPDGRVTDLTRC